MKRRTLLQGVGAFSATTLLANTAEASNPADLEWVLEARGRSHTFLPWFAIGREKTRLYQMMV
jgi:hypothetical protein